MAVILNINFMGLAIHLAIVGVLSFNVVLAQPCEGDLQGLITQCGVYVQKGGPRMDPSQGCCNVIKSIDIPCVCKYISRVIEEVIDMDKVVHVADFCGKPLTHGMKCGSQ